MIFGVRFIHFVESRKLFEAYLFGYKNLVDLLKMFRTLLIEIQQSDWLVTMVWLPLDTIIPLRLRFVIFYTSGYSIFDFLYPRTMWYKIKMIFEFMSQLMLPWQRFNKGVSKITFVKKVLNSDFRSEISKY